MVGFVVRFMMMVLLVLSEIWEVSGWRCCLSSNSIGCRGFVLRAFSSPSGFFGYFG